MSFCPNCKGFTHVNKKKTLWRCKRGCDAGGVLNPNHDVYGQMQAQYPNPTLKYPENKNDEQ